MRMRRSNQDWPSIRDWAIHVFHRSEEVGLEEEDEISAECEVEERGACFLARVTPSEASNRVNSRVLNRNFAV